MSFGLWHGGSHLGYGTHLPILAAACMQTKGPILEFGLGFYSTPFLHLYCAEVGRQLISLENDALWAAPFFSMKDKTDHYSHEVHQMPWGDLSDDIIDRLDHYGIVFIDHNPEDRRPVDAARLCNRTDLVVVHDWSWDAEPDWQKRLGDLFTHKWVSKSGPRTAVLSNFQQFSMS